MPGELKVTGVRALGELLGISKSLAARLTKEPWFPARAEDGSWATLEVQRAYADHKTRQENNGRLFVPETRELDELRRVLATSKNPEEIAQANVQLVARGLATAESLAPKDVLSMKAALEELRKGAAGYLELRKKKGEVIERDVAKVVIGQMARRAVAVLERYEVQLAQRVELWLADASFLTAPSEERARIVRAWASSATQDVRRTEAEDVERLIAAEVKEQSA